MADTDTDPTPTPTTTTEVKGAVLLETTSTTKPGWRTSEFWKGLIVLALVSLLTSGVIPTTGAGAQIAAIAGIVLTGLGYTGARAWLKGGGAVLLLVFLAPAAASTGCSSLGSTARATANYVVDCTVGESKAAATELGPVLEGAVVQSVANGGRPDFGPLKLLAKTWTAGVGGCALAAAVQAVARAAAAAPKTFAQQIDPVALRVAFRELATTQFEGWGFHTAAGDL